LRAYVPWLPAHGSSPAAKEQSSLPPAEELRPGELSAPGN
jgi:hypothetical protein